MAKSTIAGELMIDGRAYVVIPKADYLRLAGLPPGTVDAKEFARASIADALKAAREEAGLTQGALAKRLKKSQPMIARAESGATSVGEKYIRAVLKACGLPKDWKPKTR